MSVKGEKKQPQGDRRSVRLERNTPGCKHYTTTWGWVMAPGFNTRCNPQLLWAIIRPAKQLRAIGAARIPQGQKVKETLLSSLSGSQTFRNTSCKNCKSCVRLNVLHSCWKAKKTWFKWNDSRQLYVKALTARYAWEYIAFTWRYEALSVSLCPPSSSFFHWPAS